jgi:hypothetical protein
MLQPLFSACTWVEEHLGHFTGSSFSGIGVTLPHLEQNFTRSPISLPHDEQNIILGSCTFAARTRQAVLWSGDTRRRSG